MAPIRLHAKMHVSVFLVIFLLMSIFLSAFAVHPANAEVGTITIAADGSINPSSSPISQTADNYYTLTSDTSNRVAVERDNIVLDGAGHSLKGAGMGPGIQLTGRTGVTIKNFVVDEFGYGIRLFACSGNIVTGSRVVSAYSANFTNGHHGLDVDSDSSGNRISENTVANCFQGINVNGKENNVSANVVVHCQSGLSVGGQGNIVSANSASDCRAAILVSANYQTVIGNMIIGNDLGLSIIPPNAAIPGNAVVKGNRMVNNTSNFQCQGVNDVDTSNTINGKPIYYWINKQDLSVPSDAGYVALLNCRNITVQNLVLSNNAEGIMLDGTTDSTVTQCVFSHNDYGVHVSQSNRNYVTGNVISYNFVGLSSDYGSSDNDFSSNNIAYNNLGARVESGSNNVVTQNIISSSLNYGDGLLMGGTNNTVFGNSITDNYRGLSLSDASACVLFENNVSGSFMGLYLSQTFDCKLFHNNFSNNTNQIITYQEITQHPSDHKNLWDDGYPSGGNYWSNYTGSDVDSDGIGDVPQSVADGDFDHYPLMNPFNAAVTVPPPPLFFIPQPLTSPAPTQASSTIATSSPRPSNQLIQPIMSSPQPPPASPSSLLTIGVIVAASVIIIGVAVTTARLLKSNRNKNHA